MLILTRNARKKINARNSHINQKLLTISRKTPTIQPLDLFWFLKNYPPSQLYIEKSLISHCTVKKQL